MRSVRSSSGHLELAKLLLKIEGIVRNAYFIYSEHMGKHLKNLLVGISSTLAVAPAIEYVRPSRNSFLHDSLALRGDAAKVTANLRANVGRYGKQIHKS
jgi:hypothetical protein